MIRDAVLQFDNNIFEKKQMFYLEIQLLDLLFSVIAWNLFGFVWELKMEKKENKSNSQNRSRSTYDDKDEVTYREKLNLFCVPNLYDYVKKFLNLNSINVRIFIELIEYFSSNHLNHWFKHDLFFSLINDSQKKTCPHHNQDFPTIFFAIMKWARFLRL
jgi:hypothetical protein